MGWLSNTITAAASLFQGYENRHWQERMQQQNMEWQEGMQQKSMDWQNMMYEKQKNDNSYKGQLQQLQEAGLSPAMIAQSTFQPAQGQSAPSMPTPATMPMSNIPFIGDEVSKIYDNLIKEREIQKRDIENEYLPALNDAALKKAAAEFDKLVADKLLSEEQANQIKEMLPLLKNKTEAEIDELQALYSKIEAETKNLDQDEKYKKWKNDFLQKFGFNPEAPGFNAIIQALVSGKGATIIDSMVNTLKGIFKESDTVEDIKDGIKTLEEKEKERWTNKVKEKIEKRKKRIEKQNKKIEKRRKTYDVTSPTEANSTYFHHGR
jgi:hypothetical protein